MARVINLRLQMDHDTDIGGPHDRFPITSYSAIVAARSEDHQVRQRALEAIVAGYWKPAYKYLRIKWQVSNEDAKDLVQGFFAHAIEKNYFASYDSAKASFQTFFRTCLDRFVANTKKAEQRLKRGGGADRFSLDFNDAESELALHGIASDMTPEDYFHREWVRNLFTLAIQTLERHYDNNKRSVYFKLFEAYDLQDDESGAKVSYGSLADEFGLNTMDVTNHLAAARREFRRIVLGKLREITATEEEFRSEARSLLGVEIK